jgi:flagellar hook-associated protein 3 FlgL
MGILVDPNYTAVLSSALSASTAQEQTLTSELSSGLRVATLSDDPVAASANVGIASSIAGLDSFVQTASGVQGRLQAADSTLGEVVSQVTSAISLATQGANGTLNTAQQQAIANEVSGIRDTVLSLANSAYQGTYLFSGSQGQTQPFSLDQSTIPPTTVYAGDTVVSTISTPGGQQLAVNIPGSSVFTASGSSVLDTLNQLVNDLLTGSTASVAQDATALSSALSTVDAQRSTLDTSLSQLTSTSDYAQTQVAEVQSQQSTLLSADTATVASSLQTAEVQHQALISVISTLDQNNLFSYLK